MKNDFKIFKSEIKNEILEDIRLFEAIRLPDYTLPEGFVDWFVATGNFFNLTYPNIPQTTTIQNSTIGNCFHNSQLVSLQNDKTCYIEGIMRGASSKKAIHHGFNLVDNKILDVTYLNNTNNYTEAEALNDNTFFYFGVEIDKKFFIQNSHICSSRFLNNPLILKYYLEK